MVKDANKMPWLARAVARRSNDTVQLDRRSIRPGSL